MIRAAARWAAVLVLSAVVVVAGAACDSSGGDRIDPRSLERELTTVLGLELLAAHFFGRDVKVSCLGSGTDDLHFTCHVDATNPSQPTQSWNLTVSCLPPGGRNEPRCFSDRGDALQ